MIPLGCDLFDKSSWYLLSSTPLFSLVIITTGQGSIDALSASAIGAVFLFVVVGGVEGGVEKLLVGDPSVGIGVGHRQDGLDLRFGQRSASFYDNVAASGGGGIGATATPVALQVFHRVE